MIAILAGAGVIAVSHFKVRPQIEGIIAQREKNAKDRDMEKSAKVKAQNEQRATAAKLKQTETTLGETQTQLAATKQQAEGLQKQVTGLKGDLDKSRQDATEAHQKLSAWELTGLQPDQIKILIDSEKKLRAANQALDEEKKFFAKKYKDTKAQLDSLLNEEIETPMPADLRGNVLVVDPKWNFVVLDVGEKQGAAPNGVMMVSRNSKLVAKIKIMSVLAERSIANIMPGWKLAEVMEGDRVIH